MKKLVANSVDAGKRLDVFTSENMPKLSRSFIKTLCDTGQIKVNGKLKPPKYRLKDGDDVIIDFNPAKLKPADIKLPILYEDDDCLVIDKPNGVLTHSKGAFNPEPTVATFIVSKVQDLEGERAGIVHRLDRATSGVIICAKNLTALNWLQKQFSQRKVKKTYFAIIEGELNPSSAVIDMPIDRNPKNPKTFRVSSSGRQAVTEYKTVKTNQRYSLLELHPATGRTHQLRVHLKQLGKPIVGDILYGGEPADRLFLHANSLELTLPNKERRTFISPLPKEFNKLIK